MERDKNKLKQISTPKTTGMQTRHQLKSNPFRETEANKATSEIRMDTSKNDAPNNNPLREVNQPNPTNNNPIMAKNQTGNPLRETSIANNNHMNQNPNANDDTNDEAEAERIRIELEEQMGSGGARQQQNTVSYAAVTQTPNALKQGKQVNNIVLPSKPTTENSRTYGCPSGTPKDGIIRFIKEQFKSARMICLNKVLFNNRFKATISVYFNDKAECDKADKITIKEGDKEITYRAFTNTALQFIPRIVKTMYIKDLSWSMANDHSRIRKTLGKYADLNLDGMVFIEKHGVWSGEVTIPVNSWYPILPPRSLEIPEYNEETKTIIPDAKRIIQITCTGFAKDSTTFQEAKKPICYFCKKGNRSFNHAEKPCKIKQQYFKSKLKTYYCKCCGHTGTCEWRKCKNEDRIMNGFFAERKSRYEKNVDQSSPAPDRRTPKLVFGSRFNNLDYPELDNNEKTNEKPVDDEDTIMERLRKLKGADKEADPKTKNKTTVQEQSTMNGKEKNEKSRKRNKTKTPPPQDTDEEIKRADEYLTKSMQSTNSECERASALLDKIQKDPIKEKTVEENNASNKTSVPPKKVNGKRKKNNQQISGSTSSTDEAMEVEMNSDEKKLVQEVKESKSQINKKLRPASTKELKQELIQMTDITNVLEGSGLIQSATVKNLEQQGLTQRTNKAKENELTQRTDSDDEIIEIPETENVSMNANGTNDNPARSKYPAVGLMQKISKLEKLIEKNKINEKEPTQGTKIDSIFTRKPQTKPEGEELKQRTNSEGEIVEIIETEEDFMDANDSGASIKSIDKKVKPVTWTEQASGLIFGRRSRHESDSRV